jgi:hypothetical protein
MIDLANTVSAPRTNNLLAKWKVVCCPLLLLLLLLLLSPQDERLLAS